MRSDYQLLLVDLSIYNTKMGIAWLEDDLRERRKDLKKYEAERAQLLAEVHA